MSAAALALSAFAALSSIGGIDANGTLTAQWLGQYGQTSIFRAAVPLPTGLAGSPFSLTVLVADQNGQGGSAGVFCGFDLDFILFDYDGVLNGNEFGVASSTAVFPGAHPQLTSPYYPTALHPGQLFGLDANGRLQPGVATLGTKDASYDGNAFAVSTSSGWVSLGDGGYMLAGYDSITVPEGNTLFVYVGDAGQRSSTWNGQIYYEDPLLAAEVSALGIPEPGTAALIVVGAAWAALRKRRRA